MNDTPHWLLIVMSIFYIVAGLNHFIQPKVYSNLFPPYLSKHKKMLNFLSGVAEVLLGILLLVPATKSLAAWGVIAMLVAFIPSHVYMIQQGVFKLAKFTIHPWMSWVRLLVVHPILLAWAYQYT
jgi:uncharacterized membrane protein